MNLAVGSACLATDRIVDQSPPPPTTCCYLADPLGCPGTIAAPFCRLEDGISAAVNDGDTVLVYPGEYQTLINVFSVSGRNGSINLVSAGSAEDTIIRGKVYFSLVPDPGQVPGIGRIEGFTISNPVGDGISVNNSSVEIVGCKIIGNDGTGIDIAGRDALERSSNVTDCIVSGNNDSGIRIILADSIVKRCTISGNSTPLDVGGGGLYIEGSSPMIVDSIIEDNSALYVASSGGGVRVRGTGNIWLVNTIIRNNRANYFGGGLFANGGTANTAGGDTCTDIIYAVINMQNCLVTCNEAHQGGGLYVDTYARLNLVNSTVTRNKAVVEGGGISIQKGGGLMCRDGCVKVHNSTFWDNRIISVDPDILDNGPEMAVGFGGTLEVTDSILKDGCAGIYTAGSLPICDSWTVLNSNPLFMAENGPDGVECTIDDNYRVVRQSPAVDSGNNGLVLQDVVDLDGNGYTLEEQTPLDLDRRRRFVDEHPPGIPGGDPTVDIGAYEFQNIDPLVADPEGEDKGRFVSFSNINTGSTAIGVRLTSLHHVVPPYTAGPSVPFTAFENQLRWVGPPTSYVESSSSGIPFFAATLQCNPHYQDWSTVGVFHVTGSAIVPSSVYDVEVYDSNCVGAETTCEFVSGRLSLRTSRWGDVETPYNPPSTTSQPDTADISALVNKFRNALV